MTAPLTRACWCGGALGEAIGPYYRRCEACGTAVLAVLPAAGHFDVSDDERDFYGKRYWTDYSRARHLPDIGERSRSDLSERCLFWLERLLEVTRPPGRALEIGCGHGGFVRLMQELGFDALGIELSDWAVEEARRTFGVTVLRGRLETLDLEPGFGCLAAFDVFEHLSDPLETARRCADLLTPEGVLLLQTPRYRGEGPDWSMFQEDEHVHLFTDESIHLLLARAGFQDILVSPSLFPYDMWVVASRGRLRVCTTQEIEPGRKWRLPAAFRSLLDLSRQIDGIRKRLTMAEADCAARLRQVEELTSQIRELEAMRKRDHEAWSADVAKLSAWMHEREADAEARLRQVEELTGQFRTLERARVQDHEAWSADVAKLSARLGEVEAESEPRLAQVEELTRLLRDSEADRAARLEQIHELSHLLRTSEAHRATQLEVIKNLEVRIAKITKWEELARQLQEREAARLEDVRKLSELLRCSEADIVARTEQVREQSRLLEELETSRLAQTRELSQLLQESEANRMAQLEALQQLRDRIGEIERSWVWRLCRKLPLWLTGRAPVK